MRYDNAALVESATSAFRLDGNKIIAAGRGDLLAGLTAHIAEHHELLFFTKMEDYRDEQEYRYGLFDGEDDHYAEVNFADSLLAVVLGEAFSADLRDLARDVCRDAGVVLRQMRWTHYQPLAQPLD
jgi:hypothetical protein